MQDGYRIFGNGKSSKTTNKNQHHKFPSGLGYPKPEGKDEGESYTLFRILQEQLREIWMQPNKQVAEKVMLDWVKQAQESKVPQLMKMAVTIMAYRTGILAWHDCPISTGKVEGINNKMKVMKRAAYGFRDERYFQLRLYALHDCRITPNVG